ncbi:hypothetical protein [Flavobacterium gawalongense]|uniref:Uncharacterized protein n=1 Tax=Flavobacterium gawalongense TaxID=2594432 RepID=A0ABY3CPW8_9FLAO|nr:hypothetical protein [Flavobacterium gawalongense]TRX03227.1 hypothetical protein FNW33_05195 [Flavobacterium gawalongense]TRX09889.1 hypothetical protein FNW12_01885 [Flavobacterium gawalongense]
MLKRILTIWSLFVFLFVLEIWLTANLQAQTKFVSKSNNSIILLSGERADYVVKLGQVEDELKTFMEVKVKPLLEDGKKHEEQLTQLEKSGVDLESKASVDQYNSRGNILEDSKNRLLKRKAILYQKIVEIGKREADYKKKITELENRIRDIIRQNKSECLDNGGTIEDIIVCWNNFFDGSRKNLATIDGFIEVPSSFGSTSVVALTSEDWKSVEKKRQQMASMINKTTSEPIKIIPVEPPVPEQSAPATLTDRLRGVMHYMKNMNKN